MSKVALGQGPEGRSPNLPVNQINALSRDNITAQQVGTLLAISTSVVGMLTSESLGAEGGPKDGGVRASLELVGINAADRLNEILEDKSRWNLESASSLESSLIAVHTSQRGLLDAQAEVSRTAVTPSARFSPRFNRLVDGRWVVWLGNFESKVNRIIGVGASLDEAMKAFDREFLGKSDEQKQQATNEKMDSAGKSNSGTIVEIQEVPSGDGRPAPRADDPASPKQTVAPSQSGLRRPRRKKSGR